MLKSFAHEFTHRKSVFACISPVETTILAKRRIVVHIRLNYKRAGKRGASHDHTSDADVRSDRLGVTNDSSIGSVVSGRDEGWTARKLWQFFSVTPGMYVFAHFLILFAPGLLVTTVIGVRGMADRVLVSFSVSLILVTLLIVVAKQFEFRLEMLAGIWLLLLCLGVVGRFLQWRSQQGVPVDTRIDTRIDDERSLRSSGYALPTVAAAGLVLLSVAFYLLIVGPYLEVPSDVLAHLEYLQGASLDLENRDFTRGFPLAILGSPENFHWYYLFATISEATGTSFRSALTQATIANVLTLVIVLFSFTIVVFDRIEDRKTVLILAVLATGIFVLSFGVNIFAYIRYYALAPTILNYPLYLCAVAVLLRYVSVNSVPIGWLLFIGVCLLVAWLIHEQEAIFIVVVGLGLSIYATVARSFRGWRQAVPAAATVGIGRGFVESRKVAWWCLTLLGVTALAGVVLWSHVNLPRALVPDARLVSIQKILPTVRDLYILNPTWQFYQAIAVLGVVTFAASIIFWKSLRPIPFLVVGMLTPLFTVFNPFFADFFLRHSRAENFWRFCYIIPISFVAAYLLVTAWRLARQKEIGKRILGASVVVAICVSIFLPASLFGVSTWSRWPTLLPVESRNHVAHLQDVIDEVTGFAVRTRIYSDPVTGYLLTAMTTAQSRRKKFLRWPTREMTVKHFARHRLKKMGGHVLIINMRDGGLSRNGRLSGHWPTQITNTSAYYDTEFLEFIKSQPDVFREFWSQQGVTMYRIESGDFVE